MSQFILTFFALLWLIAWGVERVAFAKPTRWWRTGLIWLGLFALLQVDAAIGYFVEYRPAVKETGNGVVLKRVVADGFLDPYGSFARTDALRTEPGFILFSKGYPYRYVEMPSRKARHSRLLAIRANSPKWRDAEYVHFFKARTGSPECSLFDALPDAASLRAKYMIPEAECIAAKQTREPISRYAVVHTDSRKLNPRSPFNITGNEQLLVDRQSGETIARCLSIGFRPQINRVVPVGYLRGSHNPPCIGDEFFSLILSAILPSPRHVQSLWRTDTLSGARADV